MARATSGRSGSACSLVRLDFLFHEVRPMWQCTKCRESIEDPFDVCWSCGTSKDGVEDPSFQNAEDAEVAPTDADEEFGQWTSPRSALPEDAIQSGRSATRFAPAGDSKCPHCNG